jgi:hypothetical protein
MSEASEDFSWGHINVGKRWLCKACGLKDVCPASSRDVPVSHIFGTTVLAYPG